MGLPGLVSATGGNVDIVQPGRTGLLFKPDDPIDLAAKLRAILHSQVVTLPPGEIRETVRHRSASHVAARYREVYEHVLGSTAAR